MWLIFDLLISKVDYDAKEELILKLLELTDDLYFADGLNFSINDNFSKFNNKYHWDFIYLQIMMIKVYLL